MTRYTTAIDILNGQPMVVPSDVGEYVRYDDPAIQAAIEAMNQSVVQYEYMLEVWKSQPTTYPNQDSKCHTRQETIRAALAGLKGEA